MESYFIKLEDEPNLCGALDCGGTGKYTYAVRVQSCLGSLTVNCFSSALGSVLG